MRRSAWDLDTGGPLAWQGAAVCGQPDVNPDWWSNLDAALLTRHAARICKDQCRVAAQCLAWGRANGFEGVYGGEVLRAPSRPRALTSPQRVCPTCGGQFNAGGSRQRFCARSCQDRALRARVRAS